MVQSERFLGILLRPLLKNGLVLIKNVLKSLADSVLIPLRLTAAASATDSAIQENFGSGMTTLINTLVTTLAKSLDESGLLIKSVSETIENEVKEQKSGFLSILLGAFAASLLGNILGGTGVTRAGEIVISTSQGQRTIREDQDF